MNIKYCLICANEIEADFFKKNLKSCIKQVLCASNIDNSVNLTFESIRESVSEVDTYIICKTAECTDEFILSIIEIIIKSKKNIINFHPLFNEEIMRFKEMAQKYNCNFKNYFCNEKTYMVNNFLLPVVCVNSISIEMGKMNTALGLYRELLLNGITPLLITVNPYIEFTVDIDNYILINDTSLEGMIDQFNNKMKNKLDECQIDLIIFLQSGELINTSQKRKNDFLNDIIVSYLKPDYIITKVPNNIDCYQVDVINDMSRNIYHKKIDCLIRTNRIIDTMLYNGEKPVNPLIIRNSCKCIHKEELFDETNKAFSYKLIVDDIINKLKG